MAWSARQYLKFEDERTRPARDLLQAVRSDEVKCAADLGCGPGNSTELLAAHFQAASIMGVDNSAEMIAAAKKRLPAVRFEQCAIEDWDQPGLWELIYSNAALQWVGGHEKLLPRLAARLRGGGSLAIQMPDNLGEPSHVAMNTVAESQRFAAKLARASQARTSIAQADWYYALLKPLCRSIDIWRTTYFHPLAGGIEAIAEWMKGTGLTPYLTPLTPDEQADFIAAYKNELAKAYTLLADGTVILPFPRLFIVAMR